MLELSTAEQLIQATLNFNVLSHVHLFLDMITSSSADVTLALRGCLLGESVYVVSFRFKAKENLQCCGNVFFDILITSKKALNVGMF